MKNKKYLVWKTDDANDSFEIEVGTKQIPSLVALKYFILN